MEETGVPQPTPSSPSPVTTPGPPPASTNNPPTITQGPISTSTPPQPSSGSQVGSSSAEAVDLRSSVLYLNRELSWIEFNARVLAEADNDAVSLYERLKFHAIVATNLDEFFMVRVAGLKQQATGEVGDLPPDGMTPMEALSAISARVHELVAQQMTSLNTSILPRLAEQGALLLKPDALSPEQLAALDARFHNEVFPILTPIAIDPGHPFPHLRPRQCGGQGKEHHAGEGSKPRAGGQPHGSSVHEAGSGANGRTRSAASGGQE